LQPKKRAKVVPANPNDRFVKMPDVIRAKARIAQLQKRKGAGIEDIATFNEIMG